MVIAIIIIIFFLGLIAIEYVADKRKKEERNGGKDGI